jgi:hypothetical protein
MAKDRTKRYSTALDLAKALNLIAFGNEGNLASPTNSGLRAALSKTPTQTSRGRTGSAVAGIILVVAVVGFFLLRNQLFSPQQIAPTLTSVPVVMPSETPTEIPTAAPTPTLIPTLVPVVEVVSVVPFAPACAAGVAIPTPVVKETNKVCVEKKPYTAMSIPEGATFEPLNSKLSCVKETTSNGRTIISCGGPQLFSYNLKVCIPPVVSSADLGKCSQDTVFDSANQCCLTPPPDGAGCTIFKVDLRACQ